MFGNRADGRKIKNVDAFFRLMPHIMKKRSDSHVYYTEDIPITKLDEYISKKEQEGIKLSYMNIIYAAIVRLIAEKPRLNRFVMNGRVYARNEIYVSLAIKKEMTAESTETTLKIPFTGDENIFEIKERLDLEIFRNKDLSTENDTDKLATILSKIPNLVLKIAVNSLRYLDRIGYLPKSIINASPFHTTVFLTNVGSLGIDAIYHHIYDFGTTGLFMAMGKKKKSFVYEDDQILEEKTISFALVADERICDGFYFANAMKSFKRYMKKPELLEENITHLEDVD